jgi:predicted amidohydrolase YtcJ
LKKQIKGIKVFTDGGFSSRSAALCDGFKDGSKGVLVRSDDELSELILNISETGKPLAIHALGDRATHQVASVLSNAYNKGIGLKVRVEHCQLVSMEDAIRLKECGVVLCMQPNFSNDSVIFADRLSRKYLERINPLRMLIDDVGFVPGRDLIFGSDGMPHGIKAALEQSLFPPLASQKLKLEEFVAGYCMPDKKNGCIEVEIDEQNKKIDFSVVI